MSGVLKAKIGRTLAVFLALLSVARAQQFANGVVLEPAAQSEPIFAPIYSLFGLLPAQAENTPNMVGIETDRNSISGQSTTPHAIQSPDSVVQALRLHLTPALIQDGDQSNQIVPKAIASAPQSESPTEAVPLSSADLGLSPGEILPSGFVAVKGFQFPGVVVSGPEAQPVPTGTISNRYLTDPQSEFDPESLEHSINNLETDIHRREEKWKQLVGAAADGRSAVEVSAAQQQANAEVREADERLREFQSSSQQALEDVRQAAEAQKARSEKKIAYAARCVPRSALFILSNPIETLRS